MQTNIIILAGHHITVRRLAANTEEVVHFMVRIMFLILAFLCVVSKGNCFQDGHGFGFFNKASRHDWTVLFERRGLLRLCLFAKHWFSSDGIILAHSVKPLPPADH
jgi:hypothetical protein